MVLAALSIKRLKGAENGSGRGFREDSGWFLVVLGASGEILGVLGRFFGYV